ncbi:hypothetical protein TTRE_0000244401 [Trichuris trichiura]|uniref:Uncharacterized protein n=1 Tax=Trichuris trichiura TaxID=36087 RepID=A0A077Z2W5_TRITR|nr:hypothetical protein TTRE_0000244401 [Trichuris trichiura]
MLSIPAEPTMQPYWTNCPARRMDKLIGTKKEKGYANAHVNTPESSAKFVANIRQWQFSPTSKFQQDQLNVKPPLTPEEMRKLEELQLLSNMEVIRLTFPYNPDKRSDSPNEPTETITLNETRSTTISPEDEDADDPFQLNKDEIVLQPNQQGESQIDDS